MLGRRKDARHSFGVEGERIAERYLRRLGYRLLTRNYRLRGGEIDLIFEDPDDDCIVFVEVKSRRSDHVRGERAIHPAKRRRLVRLTLLTAKKKRWLNRRLRIDVVIVVLPEHANEPVVRHYRDAVRLER